ncbi:MAG: CDP-alcohol phosphatidyltransferase family protein [Gammaproteobacteria bacterium]|nr:CDP-alcohol phosphatidyltransferase family protein [Gammaproteobacteria bacterium]
MTLSFIPNFICIVRIVLIIPIVYLLWNEDYLLSLFLIAVAGLSDYLDGFLAKRNNWRSELGAILDPTADKLLLISLFITLYRMNLIPYWLTVTVILRDAMIMFGLSLYRYFIGKPKILPSKISKVNTFVQIIFVLLVIAGEITEIFYIPTIILGSTVFVTSILSGVDYWIQWSFEAKKIINLNGA